MEDVLVLQKQLVTRRLLVCLNPCCGGRCSSTPNILGITNPFGVLILVVVEDVLVLIQQTTFNKQQVVLILVVVEDVLVLSQAVVVPSQYGVLILVVVEDVLVLVSFPDSVELTTVLILVVVEDVLVLSRTSEKTASHMRLNPCCGGRCSSTLTRRNNGLTLEGS